MDVPTLSPAGGGTAGHDAIRGRRRRNQTPVGDVGVAVGCWRPVAASGILQRLPVLPGKEVGPHSLTLCLMCFSGEQVHILGCEVSEEEFREGFDASINSQLVYHDLYRDPLNWSKTGEAFPGGPLGVLRAMCRKTDPRPVTVALDSLSWLLLHLPCTTLCQTLHALNRQDSSPGAQSPIKDTDKQAATRYSETGHDKRAYTKYLKEGTVLESRGVTQANLARPAVLGLALKYTVNTGRGFGVRYPA
ncbi:elongator complex protein 5 isoform X3 [Pteropus vampyrus]|uniref:Elongator complex protein 5 n=1 Tax=Pteropus vampyrus TaxID=132908 RepID=A0A6P6CDZ7_PTEVA|nr:elongator complex protein 5 isoform X3 [Pteropus vampyrus]